MFISQATPTDPPSSPEVFAINLYIESLSTLSAKIADGRGTAVVEPRGVVKLRYDSHSDPEGSTVSQCIITCNSSSYESNQIIDSYQAICTFTI